MIFIVLIIYPFIILMSARKTLKNSSILSGTPTQQPSLSPSRKQIMKSPLSTSKYLAQSNNRPNVSYGELQIVLQSIQQIRLKANNQVKALTLQNNQLKGQLVTSQETIKGLNAQIQKYQNKHSQGDQKIKWQLFAVQNQKGILQTQLQEKQKRIIALEVKNKELQKEIQNEVNKFQLKKKEIEECKSKWKWAFTILAGNEERAEEMVWKVKNESKGGLWTIIETYAQQDQIIELKNKQIVFLQNQIQKVNVKNRQSLALLDKCHDELNSCKNKISEYEQEAKLSLQIQSNKYKQLNDQKIELLLIVQHLKSQIDQLKQSAEQRYQKLSVQLDEKNQKIHGMRQQLLQKEKVQNEIKKKRDYQNLICELCDDSEESTQLLERVRYLQRFRSQHFFNIQKIQFLCKLLDN